ncbi:MAG: hypothetical protein KC492_27945 [Myxococcales bacterium]|nr:hypothetical protein [Myxococcales bacterium]
MRTTEGPLAAVARYLLEGRRDPNRVLDLLDEAQAQIMPGGPGVLTQQSAPRATPLPWKSVASVLRKNRLFTKAAKTADSLRMACRRAKPGEPLHNLQADRSMASVEAFVAHCKANKGKPS